MSPASTIRRRSGAALRRLLLSLVERPVSRALRGRLAWPLLDRLGVPGFGTQLLRTYFPLPATSLPTWESSDAAYASLAAVLARHEDRYVGLLEVVRDHARELREWPVDSIPGAAERPHLQNEFLPLADAAVLHALLSDFKPRRYVEIGSGISTRIAARVRAVHVPTMEIVSIDPAPRADIDGLCTEVIRQPAERIARELAPRVGPGDVLFIDGSHHAYPGSDVTHLFFNVLPALPRGAIVHLHDIYLPNDYPDAIRGRFWSEQYLLGALLLGGGGGFAPLFPAAYLSAREPFAGFVAGLHDALLPEDSSRRGWHLQGTSYWMVRT